MMELTQLLGNIGEFVGAFAVVATLIYLSVQVRHSRTLLQISIDASEENARLLRAAAIDRHSDAVSRWRGRLIENEEVAQLWQNAIDGQMPEGVARTRLESLVVDWINTYRSNFYRARAVGDHGLARQAVLTTAPLIAESPVIQEFWRWGRPMNEVSALDFVQAVEEEAGLCIE